MKMSLDDLLVELDNNRLPFEEAQVALEHILCELPREELMGAVYRVAKNRFDELSVTTRAGEFLFRDFLDGFEEEEDDYQ